MGSRFDYVKYDDEAMLNQNRAKEMVCALEKFILDFYKSPSTYAMRSSNLAITKLEECYMWIGKLIRDDQIGRNGRADL